MSDVLLPKSVHTGKQVSSWPFYRSVQTCSRFKVNLSKKLKIVGVPG